MRRLHFLRYVAIVGTLSVLLAAGCASPKKSEPADPFMDKWKAKAQESKDFRPAFPAVPRTRKRSGVRPSEIKVETERPLPTKRSA